MYFRLKKACLLICTGFDKIFTKLQGDKGFTVGLGFSMATSLVLFQPYKEHRLENHMVISIPSGWQYLSEIIAQIFNRNLTISFSRFIWYR